MKTEARAVPTYARAVGSHSVWLIVAAIAVIGGVADASNLWGGSDQWRLDVPRWVWWATFAVGLVVAQFRAYHDVLAELTTAKAKLLDLADPSSKLRYLDQQLDFAERQLHDLEKITELPRTDTSYGWQDSPGVKTLVGAAFHWEAGVTSTLREWFSLDDALLFEDDDVDPVGPDWDGQPWASKANTLAHMRRRIARLEQIRSDAQ